jgi:hypothetical protein
MSTDGRIVSFRVSNEEYARLQSEAAAQQTTPGRLARSLVIGTPTTPAAQRSLTARLEVVENTLRLAGLGDAIKQAQQQLAAE